MDAVRPPELIVLVWTLLFTLVPLAAGVWALVMLHRIRVGQDAIRARLDAIERMLPRS